ncbi:uncharacterized protein LOC115627132 [Scaptodrosophila lebanonensis]|uniref:Uncharacterized protein LOC115627132 n=1 Tax=Drosophila lebanonensis TaxID=7225 RepID=A0A6J2TSN4_DROLE|nr:uncharacterized protein LOC115627132 [Scaptodrosophila lebanonensis]
MAEDSYEYERMRAELLGIEPPDKAEFERARSARLEAEQAELDAAEAAILEKQDESLRWSGGKVDELSSILSSTQQKLNRFKQTACGSLSNIFSRGSVDIQEGSELTASTSQAAASAVQPAAEPETNHEELLPGEIQPAIPTEKIRAAKAEAHRKVTSQLDKLDAIINKTDNAHIAMTEQVNQMKRMAK